MNPTGDADFRIENNLCTMRFERRFDRPIEEVWAALTEPELLAKWFYPLQGRHAVGETIFIPWDETGLTSTVVAYEPPRLLAYTWHQPGEPESIVRWELTPRGDGTSFVLLHTLPVLGPAGPAGTLSGWHEHLDTLVDLLRGNEREWSSRNWRSLNDRYAFAIANARSAGDDGSLEIINGRRMLRFERVLNAPLDRVWNAISTAEGITGWFTRAELDARPGGSILFDFTQYGDRVYTFPVLKFKPPRLFEFQFNDHPENVVRIELFDGGEQTLLVLTHRLHPEHDAPGTLGGWHHHLDRLPSYLAGEPDPRPVDHVASVTARYRDAATA